MNIQKKKKKNFEKTLKKGGKRFYLDDHLMPFSNNCHIKKKKVLKGEKKFKTDTFIAKFHRVLC